MVLIMDLYSESWSVSMIRIQDSLFLIVRLNHIGHVPSISEIWDINTVAFEPKIKIADIGDLSEAWSCQGCGLWD